jgi:hypothetical protein
VSSSRLLARALALVLAASIAPAAARAQTPPTTTSAAPTDEARRSAAKAFAAGMKAYAAKDYVTAALRFDEADHLAPHPNAKWNLARSLRQAGQLARAAQAFARYLRDAPPDAHDRDAATDAIDELAKSLVRIDVTAPGVTDVTIDGVAIEDRSTYVDPGQHVVQGHAGDQLLTSETSGDAGAIVAVTLALPPPPAPPPPAPVPEPTPSPAPTPAPPPSPAPGAPSPASHGWSPIVFWVSAGLTAAALGTAIGFGVDTVSFRNGTYASAPPSQQPADYSDGVGRMNRTNVVFGVAGAGAVFTAVTAIWLTDWHGHDASATARLGVGPGTLTLAGTFR